MIEEIENYPIDIERDFSRPLFHKAYQNENIEIPISFSTR